MNIPGNKKVVFITGSVWTGSRSAPRKMLVKDGFIRPTWFTTARRMTDARFRVISEAEFHLAQAEDKLLSHVKYGGGFMGIMKDDFESCMAESENGALVVGPPEMAAQVAAQIPRTIIFTFKDMLMEISDYLEEADQKGQLQRIDIDVLKPGAWAGVYNIMRELLV